MPLDDYLVQMRVPMGDKITESLFRRIADATGPLPDDVKAGLLTHVVQLVNHAHSHGAKFIKDRVTQAITWPLST